MSKPYGLHVDETRYSIAEGQIFAVSGSEQLLVPALDFWKRRLDDFTSPEGLALTGTARPRLVIRSSNPPTLDLEFENETGVHKFPANFPLPIDHVILDEFWMPIYVEEMVAIKEFLTETKSVIGCEVTSNLYIELITEQHQGHLIVIVEKKSAEKISIKNYSDSIPELKITPYDYQIPGISWLINMFENGLGGILGDQMGLGKTVQLIALAIYGVKRADRNNSNILIVVPSSLKGNWREEFVKFSPNYQPYFHTGPDRKFLARDLVKNRIILTTYGNLITDIDLLKTIPWELIICDEAHSLKNPDAQRRIALSLLKCKSKFLATGTPIENELMDLWSLMDLIRPGVMGERNEFRSQCEADSSYGEEIGSSIKPLILRRLVADVLKSLPPIIEIDEVLECEAVFAKAYEDLRLGLVSMTKSMPTIAILQKLRMFCCYPVLVSPELAGINDVKIDRLLDILDEIMIQENDKVLVFTSFHDSADYLLQMLSREYDGKFIQVIDGRDDQETRDAIIKEFSQNPGFSILIANPRAAGEGLNIVAANHVIHFNREWNPQKENQANARARRPGQTKTVFVHRMFYKDTIEEVISERLLQKIDLADGALAATELEGDNKSIDRALTISPIMNYANY